ncbi:MAG: collagen binding domain-containing protein, partial [Terriglobia bacterium]
MIRRSILLAGALLFFAAGKGWGQPRRPAGFFEQAGALQGELGPWRQSPTDMRLGSFPVNDAERLDGPVTRQVSAGGTAAQTVESSPQKTGQISGRIYRADTGKPLAGVTIDLGAVPPPGNALRTAQTAEDGSYEFSGLSPGSYFLSAYLANFTPANYGFNASTGTWTPTTLAAGGRMHDIDLRLHPVAAVMQMNDEPLTAAYPKDRSHLQLEFGRFSPDGKLFALAVGDPDPEQVWLYDMNRRRLTPVTAQPPSTGGLQVVSMGWSGDTLYVEVTYNLGADRYFAATVAGATEIFELSPGAKEALGERFADEDGTARNSEFILKADQPCHGCAVNLTVQTADGRKAYKIASGGWELESYLSEPSRSLVLYPRWFWGYGRIVAFDLNTRRSRETYLPVRAESLLDATPIADGFLVAYSTYGPCQPPHQGFWNQLQASHRPNNV